LQENAYKIVRLANGVHSVRSLVHGETFHPVIGPEAEAEALHVRQLRLRERLSGRLEEFVIWDVGLGAAANALTVLRATRDLTAPLRLVSFDCTLEPLRFALQHTEALPYLLGYEEILARLGSGDATELEFQNGTQPVAWGLVRGDFPVLLQDWQRGEARVAPRPPAPHAILYDPFSPARNPAMWTLPLFTALYAVLDPNRPCAMPSYSRSTLLRVTLLLAGFYVGLGHATGEKEETTVAANAPALIEEPLGHTWLQRARRSTSAEPLREPVYRQRRLTAETWEQLQAHPQFARC
jgi:hypothetical protein